MLTQALYKVEFTDYSDSEVVWKKHHAPDLYSQVRPVQALSGLWISICRGSCRAEGRDLNKDAPHVYTYSNLSLCNRGCVDWRLLQVVALNASMMGKPLATNLLWLLTKKVSLVEDTLSVTLLADPVAMLGRTAMAAKLLYTPAP